MGMLRRNTGGPGRPFQEVELTMSASEAEPIQQRNFEPMSGFDILNGEGVVLGVWWARPLWWNSRSALRGVAACGAPRRAQFFGSRC